jgi:hypothetical protein
VSNEERWSGSIEDFASRYVDELRRLGSNKGSLESHSVRPYSPLLNHFFIETASARTKKKKPPIKKPLILKTKEVRKIQKSQAKRMTSLDKYKVKNVIGEMDTGLVGIRSLKGLSKKEKKEAKKLVQAENKDRNKLYNIISKASGYDKKMQAVLRKSFFESYQEWAPPGTYYYSKHKWQKK